jgi:hypothetical protein
MPVTFLRNKNGTFTKEIKTPKTSSVKNALVMIAAEKIVEGGIGIIKSLYKSLTDKNRESVPDRVPDRVNRRYLNREEMGG